MRKYFVYSDNGFKTKPFLSDAEVCGDCGVYDYINSFNCSEIPKKCRFKLDHKANGMWEIIVNGKVAGKTAWTPYIVDISGLIKKGNNKIVCRLTTPAGGVYRRKETQEYLKSRGWFNHYAVKMLDYQPEELPSTEDLPDSLMINERG